MVENGSLLRRVAGQEQFFLNDGTPVNSLRMLARILPGLSHETFNHHVNREKNDFANWTLGVFNAKSLAGQMLATSGKEELAALVDGVLETHEAKERIDALPQAVGEDRIEAIDKNPIIVKKEERDKSAHETLLDEIQNLTEENSVLRATIIHLEKDIRLMTKKLSAFNINIRSGAQGAQKVKKESERSGSFLVSVEESTKPQKALTDFPMERSQPGVLTNSLIPVQENTIDALLEREETSLDALLEKENICDATSVSETISDSVSEQQNSQQNTLEEREGQGVSTDEIHYISQHNILSQELNEELFREVIEEVMSVSKGKYLVNMDPMQVEMRRQEGEQKEKGEELQQEELEEQDSNFSEETEEFSGLDSDELDSGFTSEFADEMELPLEETLVEGDELPGSKVSKLVEEFAQASQESQTQKASQRKRKSMGIAPDLDFSSIAEELQQSVDDAESEIGEESLLEGLSEREDAERMILGNQEEQSLLNLKDLNSSQIEDEEAQTLTAWVKNFFGIKERIEKRGDVSPVLVNQIINDTRAKKRK